MSSKIVFSAVLLALVSSAFCSSCTSPEVTTTSFTTQDATIVTNIAYIAEFSIKCGSGALSSVYAEIDGVVVPVSVVGDKYQVSWTEEIKTARSGEKIVRVYDEEGYNAYRKANRAGEETSAIPAFVEVAVQHPGAFNGPWLKSEFLAAVLSVVVSYIAISSKAKLSS